MLSAKKVTHNISQRFQKEDKFSGELGENLTEYLASYDEVSDDYSLYEKQKLKFVYNLFDEEAN